MEEYMVIFIIKLCIQRVCVQLSVFAWIERGQGGDLGKGHFGTRSIVLRALLRVILHFEGTFTRDFTV